MANRGKVLVGTTDELHCHGPVRAPVTARPVWRVDTRHRVIETPRLPLSIPAQREEQIVELSRRDILTSIAAAGATQVGARPSAASVAQRTADPYGVLVDTTSCIGCRKCEWACNQANEPPGRAGAGVRGQVRVRGAAPPGRAALHGRQPLPGRARGATGPVFVKVQCMHCDDPACCSACLVGALEKRPDGAVTYTPWRCMGCRYCMVVLPVPGAGVRVRQRRRPRRSASARSATSASPRRGGFRPAWRSARPQCLTFGRRSELLELAHSGSAAPAGRYVRPRYGEREVGGTSWLYLASVAFSRARIPEPRQCRASAPDRVAPARRVQELRSAARAVRRARRRSCGSSARRAPTRRPPARGRAHDGEPRRTGAGALLDAGGAHSPRARRCGAVVRVGSLRLRARRGDAPGRPLPVGDLDRHRRGDRRRARRRRVHDRCPGPHPPPAAIRVGDAVGVAHCRSRVHVRGPRAS